MKRYADIIHRKYSGVNGKLFSWFFKTQLNFSIKNRINILFSSKDDWVPNIRRGFQLTNHNIEFKKFSPEIINNFDLVVPLTIEDLLYLNDFPELLCNNPIPIPSRESILLCDDKFLFNNKLMELGFEKYLPKMDKELSYPYMLKKKIDQWGQNTYIVGDATMEEKLIDFLTDDNYFTQEIIAGKNEFATHILFKNNRIIRSLTMKYVFDKTIPIKGKDKYKYLYICHFSYLDLFSSVLQSIGFDGICCINYKIQNNQPMIIEINPRVGGSLCPFLSSFVQSVI